MHPCPQSKSRWSTMNTVQVGQPAPDLEVQATDDQTVRLSDLQGRYVVLYFYPKDNTPGCTTEGQDFRDHYDEFEALGAVIYGVSRDNISSHEGFKKEQCFPFDLLADTEGQLCAAFDVIKEKVLYGKKSMGIERSTFILDPTGIVRQEFRKVKVPGHVAAVLAELRTLAGA